MSQRIYKTCCEKKSMVVGFNAPLNTYFYVIDDVSRDEPWDYGGVVPDEFASFNDLMAGMGQPFNQLLTPQDQRVLADMPGTY